jgi:hypothetical protein
MTINEIVTTDNRIRALERTAGISAPGVGLGQSVAAIRAAFDARLDEVKVAQRHQAGGGTQSNYGMVERERLYGGSDLMTAPANHDQVMAHMRQHPGLSYHDAQRAIEGQPSKSPAKTQSNYAGNGDLGPVSYGPVAPMTYTNDDPNDPLDCYGLPYGPARAVRR